MARNEEQTRTDLIDPVLAGKGWTGDLYAVEETAGGIYRLDGKVDRKQRRTDYTLRVRSATNNKSEQPVLVAIVEAKKEGYSPDYGLEQAKIYQRRFGAKFVYSTNGREFVEYDLTTGMTGLRRPLSQFPTPDELRQRYEQFVGFKLDDPAAQPLLVRYSGGEGRRRYYQDAAVRAVLEKVARCEAQGQPKRALLSLATGAGKTYIAVSLLKKIAESSSNFKALFVCDRDELRTQALNALRTEFGDEVAIAGAGETATNAKVIVATYQTLGLEATADVAESEQVASFLMSNYGPNYFTHIIIDECHRSGWNKWKQVFLINPDAVQVGLTATPRQLDFGDRSEGSISDEQRMGDNVAWFGEPVYQYTLSQGMDDGYLALCQIVPFDIFHDGRPENERGRGVERDDLEGRDLRDRRSGQPLTVRELREHYQAGSLERGLSLPERAKEMSYHFFNQLLKTGGPHQKTVIFCVTDDHAQAVDNALNNLYAEWCLLNNERRAEPYAFKCTASVQGGESLPDFRGSQADHWIATTVDLLAAGVDVPAIRNVVFFTYLGSPIRLYQMMGRGSRIDKDTNKLMFRVYDYTDATRLLGEDFLTRYREAATDPTAEREQQDQPPLPEAAGGVYTMQGDGEYILMLLDDKEQKVPVAQYEQMLAEELRDEAATLDEFRTIWIDPPARQSLLLRLNQAGLRPEQVQEIEKLDDCDLYDVLAKVAYAATPMTRAQRVLRFSGERAWLNSLPNNAGNVLRAVVAQFGSGGISQLESEYVFQVRTVRQMGGEGVLEAAGGAASLMQQMKARLFA